jgi:glutathione synthase/RimK-type ligase-like ATP-grasp enzyme
MSLVIETIQEEFNLGRDKRFRGDIAQSTLYIIHELDAKQLEASIAKLGDFTPYKNIVTVDIENIESTFTQLEDKENAAVLTMHLALDNEINTHRKVANEVLSHDIFQLNPYNKIAKIFDDKYLFYALMMANAVSQPQTWLIESSRKLVDSEFLTKLVQAARYKRYMLKPRSGTENRDTIAVDELNNSLVLEHINKIHNYDDCVLQEAIEFSSEFKVLYLHGQFYAKEQIDKSLMAQLNDFLDLLDDYAKCNELIMPEIFSIDVLETMDRGYLFLEANIRPAAIYNF